MKIKLCFFLFLFVLTSPVFSQGTYGEAQYFNFTYSKVSDWSAFTGSATFTATVEGDQILFGNCNSTGPTRLKGGYSGAVRCQYIELPAYASLGYLSLYLQNGSSGTTRNLYVKVWNDVALNWTLVETIPIGGNVDQRITLSTALSKKNVKVRIDSDGQYFWFHQLEAWSSKLETSDAASAPSILTIDPAGGTVITASGNVKVQFDELIIPGTGTVTFGGVSVTPLIMGNTLNIGYSGLSASTNSLYIPASAIQNKANVSMMKDSSIVYLLDVSDPVLQSVSPADGSLIVINDKVEKIVVSFNEDIVLGSGTITFGPAAVSTSVSGNKLILSYSGLEYNSSYTLTIPAGMVKDITGNTFKADIVIHYTTYPKDNTSPLLVSQSVAEGAQAVPIGGSIYLTFDEQVEKAGEVLLDGSPVMISINGSMVGINYINLAYNTSHTVTIPNGALTDTTGNVFSGSVFQFTTKAYAAKDFDLIVTKDGSGDFATIQEAVNAVPDYGTQRTLIFIKSGMYTEKVLIPSSKQNLSLIGEDSSSTILAYNDYAGGAGGTDNSYTIDIKAPGFYAENITFKNTWSLTGGSTNQAVALMTEGDRQVFKNCRAESFQDTHYPKTANARQYYVNCFIEGATDFMFGSATAYFESCTINCVSGGQYITAPSGTTREFGLVYNNCVITSKPNVGAQTYYLGRPWKDFGKTVWLNTKMGTHIRDIGWAVWATSGDDADNHLTGFYAEYNTMNLAGVSINPTRAVWGVKLASQQASRYSIDQVFNFGAGSSTWNPLPYSEAPQKIRALVVNGNQLSWDASDFAAGYIVFRNGKMIAATTATSFTDMNSTGSDVYAVKAYNEYGAQSEAFPDVVTSMNKKVMGDQVKVYPNPFNDKIQVATSLNVKEINIYTREGKLVKKTTGTSTIETAGLQSGLYMLQLITEKGEEISIEVMRQ